MATAPALDQAGNKGTHADAGSYRAADQGVELYRALGGGAGGFCRGSQVDCNPFPEQQAQPARQPRGKRRALHLLGHTRRQRRRDPNRQEEH